MTTSDKTYTTPRDTIEAKVVYKDISIEDLADEEMMDTLRDLMVKARVGKDIVEKLFSRDEAVAVNSRYHS